MITAIERMMIVNDYIGVENGNLSHFSSNSLQEFYPHYCELKIDVSSQAGTKKGIFIKVLEGANQEDQIKILKGLLAYLPLKKFEYTDHLTDEKTIDKSKKQTFEKIERIITRLEGSNVPLQVDLSVTNETVERAIQDARLLIKKSGATSGVDRVHTALHGYLKQVCRDEEITLSENDSITTVFSILKKSHTALQKLGERQEEIDNIIKSFANALDKLNTIRNKASLSHPNEQLLAEDEAMLVIDAAHTILNYLNRKFKPVKK